MKKNQIFSSVIIALCAMSIATAFAPTGRAASAGASFWVEDAQIILNGTRPVSTVPGRSIPTDIVVGLDTTTKLVETIVLDPLAWNAGDDLAPSDYLTTGVTRTYSSSIIGSVTLPSTSGASGVYSTLRATDENDYGEHALDKDLDVHVFYTLDNLYDTVNTNMVSYGYTVANYTCTYAKLRITFDRALVDSFFGSIAGDDDFAEVRDESYTSTAAVADLFEDHFKTSMLDMIYSKVNITGYATSWTLGSEIESVMGGNETDVTIDGGSKHVSIRNAAVGFIGLYMADDDIINPSASVEMVQPGYDQDSFIHFEALDESYVVDFNIFGDFVSGGTLLDHFGLALAQIFPHVTTDFGLAFPLYVHLIVIAVVCLVAGLITFAVTKEWKAVWKTVGIAAFFTALIMFLGFPVSSLW